MDKQSSGARSSSTDEDFDLIVVGGGSGGLAGAFRAASHGAKVAMLEPSLLGGTCVNVGCVPKKAMWLAAELAEQVEAARGIGFDIADSTPLDWAELLVRRGAYIENIHAAYRRRLDAAGIAVFPQYGRLCAEAGTVVADDGLRWRAPKILLATGGQPVKPDIPGAELAGVSDDFFAFTAPPETVAIIGGGYIGVELASVLQALGSRVSLIVRQPRLLAAFDREITAHLAESFRQAGIDLQLGQSATALRGKNGAVLVETGDGRSHGPFAEVLFATGRTPNTQELKLDAAGIDIDKRGHVVVDEWQATSREGVYAVGDLTAQPQLTPVAIAAARRLMDRLFGGDADSKLELPQVPTVVFAHPPIGSVGLSEEAAREAHGDAVKVYRAEFRPMQQALSDGHRRCLFKLVCTGDDERVVGLHLIGPSSDEILQGFAVAMRMGMRKRDLRDTLAIHPTSAEEVVLI